jgi:hypothetical protein
LRTSSLIKLVTVAACLGAAALWPAGASAATRVEDLPATCSTQPPAEAQAFGFTSIDAFISPWLNTKSPDGAVDGIFRVDRLGNSVMGCLLAYQASGQQPLTWSLSLERVTMDKYVSLYDGPWEVVKAVDTPGPYEWLKADIPWGPPGGTVANRYQYRWRITPDRYQGGFLKLTGFYSNVPWTQCDKYRVCQ